jgi:outer membrane protein TolC
MLMTVLGTPVSGFAQQALDAARVTATATQSAATGPVRRLTVEDAVELAMENNLDLSVARVNPLLQDLAAAAVRTAWNPQITTSVVSNRSTNQNTGFLSGADGEKTTDARLDSNLGIVQNLPWGGDYNLAWTSARSTTNNVLSNFSPQIRSGLTFGYTQPLLRNFRIDNTRQQLRAARTDREIADVRLQETIASTARTVRNAYWDLAHAIALLEVQRQSLALAEQNLRNMRARIEIGTMPRIDAIEPEAEVARQDEAVITARSRIASAEDRLRLMVFDHDDPEFWTIRIEPTELPQFAPFLVDVAAATRNALDRRSDLRQSRMNLEQSGRTLQYLRNQALPEVNADFDYSVSGVGGTRLTRSSIIGGDIIARDERSFGAVIGDLFSNSFPTWSARLTVRYPIGQSPQDASLARTRLQYEQSRTRLRQQELDVALQVRAAARQVETNQQRVATTRRAREFAERRLEAEERKLAAGTSTNYFVLQAQRDLAQARTAELSAILDYHRSVVDFETVQEIPAGGGAVTALQP